MPGAGPSAAWTCTLAASLVQMVCAVMLRREPDGDGTVAARAARASVLRAGLLELAEQDMLAYQAVLEAATSGQCLHAALAAAADPPLAIAESAAELTMLATQAFGQARGGVRAEAATAAVLAEAVTRAGAAIVDFNLAGEPSDPRRNRARELAAAASSELAQLEGRVRQLAQLEDR